MKLIKIPNVNKMILRSLLGLLALACMFYAIKYMPLANAILLNNTSTLFIPLIVFAMTGIKTPAKIILSVVLGFIGVVLVLGPSKEIFSLLSLIGLASGIFGGIALVLTRDIAKTLHPNQIIFYYSSIGAIVALLFALPQTKSFSQQIWLYLCGVGIFGALYQVFLTFSLRMAKVRYMSSLSFFSFIFAGIFDWLIWHNVPSLLVLIGMGLVVIGGFLTIFFGARAERSH